MVIDGTSFPKTARAVEHRTAGDRVRRGALVSGLTVAVVTLLTYALLPGGSGRTDAVLGQHDSVAVEATSPRASVSERSSVCPALGQKKVERLLKGPLSGEPRPEELHSARSLTCFFQRVVAGDMHVIGVSLVRRDISLTEFRKLATSGVKTVTVKRLGRMAFWESDGDRPSEGVLSVLHHGFALVVSMLLTDTDSSQVRRDAVALARYLGDNPEVLRLVHDRETIDLVRSQVATNRS